MLSIVNINSSIDAANYYEGDDDYYTADSCPSSWWGKGADALGLSGLVHAEDLSKLLVGHITDELKLHHAGAGRRGATDATFSAPKSVSMQALIGSDQRLADAHKTAVTYALTYAERLSACRVTNNHVTEIENTGNYVVARFEHETSRSLDPQIHTHCVIINMTQRQDGQWRAMHNEHIYRNKMLLGAIYRNQLALEVQKLGYGIRATHLDGRFELNHITDAQVSLFSSRSRQIEDYLRSNGKERHTSKAWEKKHAAVETRNDKFTLDREELKATWLNDSKLLGTNFQYEVSGIAVNHSDTPTILNNAVKQLAERESVFQHQDLIRICLELGVGSVSIESIEKEISIAVRNRILIKHDKYYTTQTALNRESEIIGIEMQGRGLVAPMLDTTPEALKQRLNKLNAEQVQAVINVMYSRNQVIGIQGKAGVGKSTLLANVFSEMSLSGYKALGLAPSSSAVRELTSLKINAETISTFLNRDANKLNSKSVLIIDEAGMASTNQILEILKIAQQSHCRVIMVGDTRQLSSVEAGRPFEQLQANGMATSHLNNIQRQRNKKLKMAVEEAANGNTELAVELLNKEIKQTALASDRYKQIALDYINLPLSKRNATKVIAGTRYARSAINNEIRNLLGMSKNNLSVNALSRKDLTTSQKSSTLSYAIGDYVQADIDYPSLQLKRGDFAKVAGVDKNQIYLEIPSGAKISWQPALHKKVSVFVSETIEIAEGELIRITSNDRAKNLINGDTAIVTTIDHSNKKLTLKLLTGEIISLDSNRPIPLDYGYCSTVYSSQGQTCERILIDADSHSLTANQSTFYVAISRAKDFVSIYTDDREILPEAMSRERVKSAAFDLTRLSATENSYHHHI